MGLVAKDSGGGDYTPVPQGTHPAVCCAVIDLGTQRSDLYDKWQQKVLLGWEVDADPARTDGLPHTVWRRFTLSLHQKAGLRAVLEAWRGRQFTPEELAGFNLEAIAGTGCLVTVTHVEREGKKFSNVAGVSALPKGLTAPAATKPPTIFRVDEPDEAIFAAFSDRLKDTIRQSQEWRDRQEGAATIGNDAPPPGDDDVPF